MLIVDLYRPCSHTRCVRARGLEDRLISIEIEVVLISYRGERREAHDGSNSTPITKGRRSRCSTFQTYLDKMFFAVLSNPQMCCGLERKENVLLWWRPANAIFARAATRPAGGIT
ncbi:hypothetical protein IF1G_08238 [Cordyceps javanica]|uniref:Uncharacterized protein n=1 Tax=Cordyceps javanica TaxID=43265 RepID=A0A545UU23_9HYPO|nr:hypothetical protein IF1G_08238 [Cordyceps javanica]TQW04831.1 hypothetical protein IF2G_07474 [Cordyceps javanica]